MSISFEDAVATLKSIFPEWESEMLGMILTSNNYHVILFFRFKIFNDDHQ